MVEERLASDEADYFVVCHYVDLFLKRTLAVDAELNKPQLVKDTRKSRILYT